MRAVWMDGLGPVRSCLVRRLQGVGPNNRAVRTPYCNFQVRRTIAFKVRRTRVKAKPQGRQGAQGQTADAPPCSVIRCWVMGSMMSLEEGHPVQRCRQIQIPPRDKGCPDRLMRPYGKTPQPLRTRALPCRSTCLDPLSTLPKARRIQLRQPSCRPGIP